MSPETKKLTTDAAPAEPMNPPSLDAYKPFPVDILPTPLREIVSQGSTAHVCDPAVIALPVLSVAASAIGNTRRISLKDSWSEPSIVWTAVVAESGTVKSAGLELAMGPVRSREDAAMRKHVEDLTSYRKAMAKYKKGEKDAWGVFPEKPDKPITDRYWTDDPTTEAIAFLLQNQPRGLVMARDELDGWLGSFDRYAQKSGGDGPKWNEMFGGRPMNIDRRTGTPPYIRIPMAAVCVAGTIQPGPLMRSLGTKHRESGLAARILLAFPPRLIKKWNDNVIRPDVKEAYADVVNRLYDLKADLNKCGEPVPRLIGMNDEAKRTFKAFYNDHNREIAGLTEDSRRVWSKLEGYAARFALIFHCVRAAAGDTALHDVGRVDAESLRPAIALVRWFGNEARRIYGMFSEPPNDPGRRQLIGLIRSKGGSISESELVRACRSVKNVDEAKSRLDRFVAEGVGHWEQPPQGNGRQPSKRFVLNSSSDKATHIERY